jgi:O-antigen/teichoic acid export membrane protein
MVAGFPLTGLSLFQRLYVGTFGRLQEHPEALRRFVTHILTAAHAVVAPIAVLTLVLIDPIVRLVFGEQWLGATRLFFWLWIGCLAVPTLAPLAGLLHALGQSRLVFRTTAVGTLLTWVAGVPLALAFGEVGVAAAGLAMHVVGLTIWHRARRAVQFSVLPQATLVWACAAAAGAMAAWWHATLPISTLPQLLLCGAVSGVAYGLTLAAVGLVILRPAREALAPLLSRRPAPAVRLTGR